MDTLITKQEQKADKMATHFQGPLHPDGSQRVEWPKLYYHVCQKTTPFYFCYNVVKPKSSILIILASIYMSVNLLPQAYFIFFIKSKAENQLKF